MEPSLEERPYQSAILTISAAPLKYHNGKEPCDRFVREGSGTGLGLCSWHGVWDGQTDLSLEGISEGWKDSNNNSMDCRTMDCSSTQKSLSRIDLGLPCYCSGDDSRALSALPQYSCVQCTAEQNGDLD